MCEKASVYLLYVWENEEKNDGVFFSCVVTFGFQMHTSFFFFSSWKQCVERVHRVALHLHPLIQIKAKPTGAAGKGYFSISVEKMEMRDNNFEKKKIFFSSLGSQRRVYIFKLSKSNKKSSFVLYMNDCMLTMNKGNEFYDKVI